MLLLSLLCTVSHSLLQSEAGSFSTGSKEAKNSIEVVLKITEIRTK